MFETNIQDNSAVYEELADELIPQSVAWVSTRGIESKDNLTPFVFFGVLSFDPPIIALSTAGAGFTVSEGGENIEFTSSVATSDICATEEFVVNFPTDSTIDEIHSTIQQRGESVHLFENSDINRKPAQKVEPPRLAQAALVLECRLRDNIVFGKSSLFIGDIVGGLVSNEITPTNRPSED